MNRKQRRQREKAKKKMSPDERNLSEKILLFNQLPDACNRCSASFDNTNKEMVKSWTVVVRETAGKVRLFCPSCINSTKEEYNASNPTI